MLQFHITLSRDDSKRLENATNEAIKAIARVIEKAVLKIDREAKLLIDRGPKFGKVYIKKGIPHQASAPGQSPATDTGRLVNSITWRTFNRGLSAELGSTVDYAAFLEEGTSKMDPRPWLRPAFEAHVDDIVDEITDTLRKYLT
jgi:HK97 gp10 family phage protein